MKIDIVKVGYLYTNCYILKIDSDCIIVDPGDEVNKIIEKIKGYNVLAILITHSHSDHIGALDDLVKLYNPKVLKFNNLEEKEYKFNKFKFRVLFNSGHSKDSVSFLFEKEKCLFSGDFIFKDSIGRFDFLDSSYIDMINSINMIKKYNDLVIYPGHGDITSLDYEKKNNRFFIESK